MSTAEREWFRLLTTWTNRCEFHLKSGDFTDAEYCAQRVRTLVLGLIATLHDRMEADDSTDDPWEPYYEKSLQPQHETKGN
jgi:hypothetical protein